jgi:ubiquinone biosynthesis accessory factor UbiJ
MPQHAWPAGALAERLFSRGAAGIVAALDHLLASNDWARDRLIMHVGSRVRLGLEVSVPQALPAPVITAEIVDGGRLRMVGESEAVKPAVTMLIRPSLAAVNDLVDGGPAGLGRHLRLEGDVLLAAALGEIARHLRWDPAEDLSRLTGDVIANRIAGAVGSGVSAVADSLRRLAGNTARQFSVEATVLVPRTGLHSLGERLGGLETRLGQIEAQMPSASRRA